MPQKLLPTFGFAWKIAGFLGAGKFGCAALLLVGIGWSQDAAQTWDQAADLPVRFGSLIEPFVPRLVWLPDAAGVAWTEGEKGKGEGTEESWILLDGATGERRVGALPEALGAQIQRIAPLAYAHKSEHSTLRTEIHFVNTLQVPVRIFWVDSNGQPLPYGTLAPGEQRAFSTYAGHVWLVDLRADVLAGVFQAAAWPGEARIDEESTRLAQSGRQSAVAAVLWGGGALELRDHNLWLRTAQGSLEALTTEGSAQDPYLAEWYPSPDGRSVLVFQETVVPIRKLTLVESSPSDQLQPRVIVRDYPKPFDPIAQRRPRLVRLETRTVVVPAEALWADSERVSFVHWAPDSSRAYCLFDARGHQRRVLRALRTDTGEVQDLVEERSTTFVDTSQKTMVAWLDASNQLLWGSERSGYQHLYRIDSRTGQVLNAVTQGDWVVRRIDHVDQERGEVWVAGLGLVPGQDPYYEHLVRVKLDGSAFLRLTEGDGTHRWWFSPDRSYLVDTWSRIDQPPVTELRRTRDGSKVAELGRDRDEALLAAGFSYPLRFAAKGRDGQTDIFGIVVLPLHIEAGRRYPVIEQIYAGPHDHHVPKAFEFLWHERQLAELGFVVVRIDGMGTNWRSKAFHDVCFQNLKDAGLPDRKAWIQKAAEQLGNLDLQRVGIYGGSAGGQSALAALLHHGEFYKAGAADCGCHDNRMDKRWWNEAWMGLDGPHYAANANATYAAQLRGDLLLTVGELDTNVDPASTLQVVNALLKAGKDFTWLVVPGAGHGIGERPDLAKRRALFFVRSLYGER